MVAEVNKRRAAGWTGTLADGTASTLPPVGALLADADLLKAAVASVTDSAQTRTSVHRDWITPNVGTRTRTASGEVIGQDKGFPETTTYFVDAWMKSDGHRAILMNGRYDSGAFAYSRLGDDQVYFAGELADFAAIPTPAPPPVTPTPVPTTQPTGTLIALPPSIDATGGSDVSAALAAFLGSVGNGTATTPKVVAYRPDGIYRLDNADALRLSGRSYLTLWGGGDGTAGKGAQVKAGAAFGKANPRGVIATVWSPCTGLRFEGFRIYGNVPAGQYTHGVEGQHALMVFAGSDISYVRNYSTGLTGDCVSVGGASDHSWPTRINVTDNFSDGNGRMAFSIVQGRDVVFARNKIDRCGLFVFDIEPDDTQQGAINCQFVDNEAFAYGLSSYYTDYFFAADGAAAVVDGITVSRNKVHGGYGLRSTSEAPRDATGKAMRRNITLEDNVSDKSLAERWAYFAHVDGLVVRRNTQPGSAGITTSDCPGAVLA
jgi:hypothetical protein